MKSESSEKIESKLSTFKKSLQAPGRIRKTSHGLLESKEKDGIQKKRIIEKSISKKKSRFKENGFRKDGVGKKS